MGPLLVTGEGGRSREKLLSAREAVLPVTRGAGTASSTIRDLWPRPSPTHPDRSSSEGPLDVVASEDMMLVRAAAPVLDQLVIDVSGARVAFVLTNAQRQVVDRRVCDRGLAARVEEVLQARRRGAVVDDDAHCAETFTDVACAAAPIVHPTSRQTVGTVGLACFAGEASPLMLPLARKAAREIEQRLVDTAGIADRIMLQRFLRERKRAKGPVILISERRMIANAAADRLLTDGDELILRRYARRLLDHVPSHPSTVVLTNATTVNVHGEPVLDGRTPVGALIRMHELAARPGGGRRRRDGATFGWPSLTDTERSVTDLVSQGLTNRETADRLFLSRHTVGSHLRSVFRKLDVNSRVELTRLVIQRQTSHDALPVSYQGAAAG